MSGVKIGSNSVNRVLFNKEIVKDLYDLDFVKDWIVNPDNSAGVTVEQGKITVTKVKPKTWFIRSNYGFTTAAQRYAKFKTQKFVLNGLQVLWNDSTGGITVSTDHPEGDTSTSYQGVGLVFAPINKTTGKLLSQVYPWDMSIPGGFWKHVYGYTYGGNWNVYGFGYNEEIPLYAYPKPGTTGTYINDGYNTYPEVAFAFWTGVAGNVDDDGYLTLTSPFTISLVNNYVVDPCSKETYDIKMKINGEVKTIFNRTANFANTLLQHGLAKKNIGQYEKTFQGLPVDIHKSLYQIRDEENTGLSELPYAYVVDAGDWTEKYRYLAFKIFTDLTSLLNEGFPLKFFCSAYNPEFWWAIRDAFKEVSIKGEYDAQCLFAFSNVETDDITDPIHLVFAADVNDTYFVLDSMFDYSKINNAKIELNRGRIQSLHNAFRQTTNLQKLEVINYGESDADGSHRIYINDYSGAFEGSALTEWAENLAIQDNTPSEYSEDVCDINYGFDASKFHSIGTVKDEYAVEEDDIYFTVRIRHCLEAFRGSSVDTIAWILDMKFVTPGQYTTHRMFEAPNLSVVRIKNLNKGDWCFDGVTRNGHCEGNLTELYDESIVYLFENLYDLSSNPQNAQYLENEINSFNGWSVNNVTKHSTKIISKTGNGSIARSVTTGGTLKINCSIPGGGSVSLVNNDGVSILGNGISSHVISPGQVEINVTNGVLLPVEISIVDHFKSEVSEITTANLYCPAYWEGIVSSDIIAGAKAKGWSIYFGGNIV